MGAFFPSAGRRPVLVGLAVAFVWASPTLSQDTTRTTMPRWMVAYSMGVPGVEGEPMPLFFTFGVNFTRLRMSALSPDFSLSTAPVAIAAGIPVLLVRGGVALPMAATNDVVLVPSAGATSLVLPFGASLGTHVGIAVAHVRGLRAGISQHRFRDDERTYWLLELGTVSHSHPPRSAAKLRRH